MRGFSLHSKADILVEASLVWHRISRFKETKTKTDD